MTWGPRNGPTVDVGGLEPAPHTPQRSERPGEPVALLYLLTSVFYRLRSFGLSFPRVIIRL